jgi:hypothetical protein
MRAFLFLFCSSLACLWLVRIRFGCLAFGHFREQRQKPVDKILFNLKNKALNTCFAVGKLRHALILLCGVV